MRQFEVVLGLGYQFTDKVIYVRPDVTGFTEPSRIRFDKRHTDKFGDVSDEICFADAGRSEHDDVLLGVISLRSVWVFVTFSDVVVVVTDGDSECLLCFVLFDDVSVEVLLNLPRLEVELQIEGVFRLRYSIFCFRDFRRGFTRRCID